MVERMRRPLAWLAVVVGVLLACAVAGPVDWGLGVVLAVALVVGGVETLTNPAAAHVHVRRRER